MRKLIINCLIFSFPLLICMGFFVIDDPFAVFYKTQGLVEASEDVVKTRLYLKNYDKEKYTAFIFGNSRVHGFLPGDWKKHIGDQNIFYFGAPGECVLNIKRKIELILERQQMKDVIILIDERILINTNNEDPFYKGPVYNHSPVTSNVSHAEFYGNYVRYYFSDLFFLKHMVYKLTGKYSEKWMKDAFAEPGQVNLQTANKRTLADSLIETNFQEYKKQFKPDYSPLAATLIGISQADSVYLCDIKHMLDEHHVNYKFVIPPDFLGHGIKGSLKAQLQGVLGEKLYDLSDFKKVSTDSTLNYENLHFTRKAGAMILDSIYHRN